MFLKDKIFRILTAVICPLFFTAAAMAQEAAPAAKKASGGTNQLVVLMVVLVAVLAFVIWGLGQVLTVLIRQVLDKRKQIGKQAAAAVLIILLLCSQAATAGPATAASALPDVTEPNYGGLSSTLFYMFLIVVIAEIIAVIALLVAIRSMYSELMPERQAAAAGTSRFSEWWSRMDKKLFTKAVPVAREADVMLDHDYDGIKELDNALPPWWKYGFYITIAVGLVYLLNFHVFGTGKNPTQEYAAEMNQARIEKELYEAGNKDKIDENNVPMAGETGLARAKEIFNSKCWSCHGKLGEGGAGPNLTDDYWLHKGSLNDIYRSIKTGYPDKGMQSWATDYTPLEMSYLASYIKTLRGTNPPGARAPQGEPYTEEQAPAAGADSAAKAPVPAAADTAAAPGKK